MTRLEALEIQEQRLRSIVELAPACLARVTRDGTVLAMNGAARSMLGASEAREVLKKSLCSFATEADRDCLRAFVEQGCDGKAASLEISMTPLNGEPREIEASIVALPARGGAAATALVTFRDVSGYRHLEESVIASARAEAEKDARAAADRLHEAELARARGEVENAAHVATALREAAIRDAAQLEALEGQLADLEVRCQQLATERDAQAADVEAARADARAIVGDRDALHQQLDESRARAEAERAELAGELEDRRREIARLREAQVASERAEGARADSVRAERARALEEQQRESADYRQAVAERDELKRTFETARAVHATEMAIAFADRAALERRVQETDARVRRVEAEIARVTAERDGVARSLAESQQHEQLARRWLAHWIELEHAMQLARADLHQLADWACGKNGRAAADAVPVARSGEAAVGHSAAGDAPWS